MSHHQLLLLVFNLLFLTTYSQYTTKITILHTNDVHSRFLQTNQYSGSCSEEENANNECYGGFPRLHYKVNEIKTTHPNDVLYLSGGDYYQGTVWYTLYKWKVISKFVNVLNHTAMALGNHEFDDGTPGLLPFLKAATFPIISCNIDPTEEPELSTLKKSIVTTLKNGEKVGIIGFTTEETMQISNPGKLIFNDVVDSIKKEAAALHASGVKILIAVGHAGYDVDQKIAKEVPHIDVVVGGHTNTFLYSGKPPDIEEPLGPYPTIVVQDSGRKVPVVQAYAFGKYLGYLNVTFDQNGEVLESKGNPILLDHKVPQDPILLADLEEYGKNISILTKQKIGSTRVFLNGSQSECRLRECNLANLITGAMVHVNLKYSDDVYWNDVSLAIMNGGGVRGSINEQQGDGSISMDDILTVMPFSNTIDLIEIQGKYIRKAFEFSVTDYDPRGHHLPGKFLQVSGIKVVYDIGKPNGARVRSLRVRCSECRVPKYEDLRDDVVYKVAVPSYIATGGDGYDIFKEKAVNHHLQGILDSDMIVDYIKTHSPIIQGVEERIIFENSNVSSSIIVKVNSFVILTMMIISRLL